MKLDSKKVEEYGSYEISFKGRLKNKSMFCSKNMKNIGKMCSRDISSGLFVVGAVVVFRVSMIQNKIYRCGMW